MTARNSRFTLTHNTRTRDNLGRFRILVTTDDRDQFADGLSNHGDVSAEWIPLTPIDVASAEGATMIVQDDLSILVQGGDNRRDTYTVTAVTELQGITGIRLETIKDSSLPGRGGPGRGSGGNATLTEFSVSAKPATLGYRLSAQVAEQLATAMQGVNSTAYVRIPFELDSPASFDQLLLSIGFSDAFVAYINGYEIARYGVSDPVSRSSVADADRDKYLALSSDQFDVSDAIDHLRVGTNILAIQVVRPSIESADLFAQAELIGVRQLNVIVNDNLQILARTLDGNQWSALSEAVFTVESPLRITEINYHPHAPTPAELAVDASRTADDFEFIEIQNTGPASVNLSGFHFTSGIEFAFGSEDLGPGQFASHCQRHCCFPLEIWTGCAGVRSVHLRSIEQWW